MGIYDREYYREDVRRRRPVLPRALSVNTWLIVVNVAVFVLNLSLPASTRVGVFWGQEFRPGTTRQQAQAAVVDRGQRVYEPGGAFYYHPILLQTPRGVEPIGREVRRTAPALEAFGHFSTYQGFQRLEVWRLVTFQFLHADWLHLFFNMFGLYLFGGMVEQFLGRKRYLAFYLVCGIFGGLTYLALNLLGAGLGLQLRGLLFNETWTPLVGASAGVFGVIMACAFIEPKAVMYLLFPPIPVTIRTLAYAYVGVAAFNLITGGHNAGGDAAHLGGAAAGFFFIRNPHLLRDFFEVSGLRGGRGRRRPALPQGVDAILDKIQREGMASLTAGERDALRRASRAGRPLG